jgi:hypothetical protein
MELRHCSDEAAAIGLLRATLDAVFSDNRFFARKSLSPGQVAHYVLTLISHGERDLDRLKTLTFQRLLCGDDRVRDDELLRIDRKPS